MRSAKMLLSTESISITLAQISPTTRTPTAPPPQLLGFDLISLRFDQATNMVLPLPLGFEPKVYVYNIMDSPDEQN